MRKLNHKPCSPFILFFTVLLITFNTTAEEILFSEDFQSGEISDEWVFFGDPTSIINLDRGNPAPCFCNNGDSMYGSGIKSRRAFSLEEGMVIECDIFLSCHPRGAWVNSEFGIYALPQTSGDPEPPSLISIFYAFSGELDWMAPHQQGMIGRGIRNQPIPSLIHMNQWLDGWHTFKIEITPEGLCSFMIDDSLLSSHQLLLLDSVDRVGIVLKGRSTSWGIALHDNLLVYLP
ncbi:MAG: hypothetical protein KAS73_11065 [Candidatus Sabulitectum sp.]|nr:hypothetical protein [Candidatus Sabulitectum sp.]